MMEMNEMRCVIRMAVSRLPESMKVVVELVYFEGCKHAEVAARLAIPEGTVKSRLHSATKTLRAAILEDDKPVIDLCSKLEKISAGSKSRQICRCFDHT
jgi:DNA-directed RNA polymerase specialized sigma24 family protein